jgi:Flp pilus assembly protein TadD
MSNSKTSSAPKAATKKTAPAGGANRTGQGQGAAANPQAQRQRRPSTIDETIAKAQHGRVNVTPAKAIEMAGQLYSRRQYGQAERVCRQIIAARPGNADAHNILGVSLAALGNT